MTEAGSVVADQRRRIRPTRAPARLVRQAGAGLRDQDRRPDTDEVERRSASCASAGRILMQRYYKRSREECFDADGWFHTGDLVRADADGSFYFIGRRGSMIKTAGANVSPAEVEKAIAKVTGGTAAHVVGIPDRGRADRWWPPSSPSRRRRSTSRRCATNSSSELSAYKIPEADRRRGTVRRCPCCPAARSTCAGSRRCSMTDHSTIDELVRHRAAQDAAKPMVIDPVSRDHLSPNSTQPRTRLAAALRRGGVGKGTRVGLIMPNGSRWVQIAIALTRIGAVLVPLSTLLAPPRTRRATAGRVRAVSWSAVEEFRGHRYLDELKSESSVCRRICLRCASVWTLDQLPQAPPSDRCDRRRRRGNRDAQPTPWSSCSPRAAADRPRASSTHTATRWAPCGPAWQARCIDADTRLYLPMPFFWVGGFGSGMLSALLAGATLVTEEIPQPETTLRLLERERVTLFRGWPDQAKPWPARRSRSAPTCPRCGRAAWRRCCRSISGLRRARGPSCSA